MYGLPQAGRVANDHLLPRLQEAGYTATGQTPGLFSQKDNDIVFALVVDDFLIHHTSDQALTHLIDTLQQHYTITVERQATKFCGMQLDWDYNAGHVTLSMPGYVEKALQRFTHLTPTFPQHSPHQWTPPTYGAKIHYAEEPDESSPISKHDTTRLQQIIGTLLFYA